jgi:hypothetical protein
LGDSMFEEALGISGEAEIGRMKGTVGGGEGR